MSVWPTSWRQDALRSIGVEVSQHALDVLRDWHASTPVQPWTNNPLGLPAYGNGAPEAMGTPYAAFPDHGAFNDALALLASRGGHLPIQHALHPDTSIARAWQSIHALDLPGNGTETDYPAVLLDRVAEKYRKKLQTVPVSERKSMGEGIKAVDMHHPVIQAARGIHHAAANIRDVSEAIRYLTQRIQ